MNKQPILRRSMSILPPKKNHCENQSPHMQTTHKMYPSAIQKSLNQSNYDPFFSNTLLDSTIEF